MLRNKGFRSVHKLVLRRFKLTYLNEVLPLLNDHEHAAMDHILRMCMTHQAEGVVVYPDTLYHKVAKKKKLWPSLSALADIGLIYMDIPEEDEFDREMCIWLNLSFSGRRYGKKPEKKWIQYCKDNEIVMYKNAEEALEHLTTAYQEYRNPKGWGGGYSEENSTKN